MDSKKTLICTFLMMVGILLGCGSPLGDIADDGDVGTLQQAVISLTDADQLILDGRADLGTDRDQCKVFVQNTVSSSYSQTIPSNAANLFEWNSSSAVTNRAQWRGSYANGRAGSSGTSLNAGASLTPTAFTVPNSDPQIVVVYASTTGVTATMTKGGSSLAVTSTSALSGTISSTTISGSGSWTLSVTNGGGTTANGVVAVVLSRSRFVSDWETARRGDMMQMYGGTSSSNRNSAGPHTTFVQTDYNNNGSTSSGGSCSGTATGATNTHGCNWLDSNWASPQDEIVRAHNISLNAMILMMAYRTDYGFTVYRLE